MVTFDWFVLFWVVVVVVVAVLYLFNWVCGFWFELILICGWLYGCFIGCLPLVLLLWLFELLLECLLFMFACLRCLLVFSAVRCGFGWITYGWLFMLFCCCLDMVGSGLLMVGNLGKYFVVGLLLYIVLFCYLLLELVWLCLSLVGLFSLVLVCFWVV